MKNIFSIWRFIPETICKDGAMKNKLILFFLMIAMMAFQIPGSAQVADHIKPYGNLYFFFGGRSSETYDSGQTKRTTEDLLYRINNNSNLGFAFRYAGYSGIFELGIDDADNDYAVKIRKAYGEYKLGFGEFMIGQTWSPYVSMSNEAADYYRSKGFGALYEEPTLQMKLSFYGFYVDIMKPYVPTRDMTYEQAVNLPTSGTSTDEYQAVTVKRDVTTGQPLSYIKSFLPKAAIGYEFTTDDGKLNVSTGLAGNAYYINKTENNVVFNKKWILSYLAYLNSSFSYNRFSVKYSGGFIVNPANYGILVQSQGNTTYYGGAAMAIKNPDSGKWEIKDTWNGQNYLELGYAFTSNMNFNIGYGLSVVKYPYVNTKYDLAMEYYTSLKINIGGLIALTPSLSYRDYMKDMSGWKEGHEVFLGVLATVSYY
jgi:hypothetical protein